MEQNEKKKKNKRKGMQNAHKITSILTWAWLGKGRAQEVGKGLKAGVLGFQTGFQKWPDSAFSHLASHLAAGGLKTAAPSLKRACSMPATSTPTLRPCTEHVSIPSGDRNLFLSLSVSQGTELEQTLETVMMAWRSRRREGRVGIWRGSGVSSSGVAAASSPLLSERKGKRKGRRQGGAFLWGSVMALHGTSM